MKHIKSLIKILPHVGCDSEQLKFAKGSRYLKRVWPLVVIDLISGLGILGLISYIIWNG